MYYKDRRGVCVPYQEKDPRYDITQGYLQKEGAGQVIQEGALHRGPVGAGRSWGRVCLFVCLFVCSRTPEAVEASPYTKGGTYATGASCRRGWPCTTGFERNLVCRCRPPVRTFPRVPVEGGRGPLLLRGPLSA